MGTSGWGPGKAESAQRRKDEHKRKGAEALIGWDLGPFTGVLAPGPTSPPATEYKETIRDEK